MEAIRSRRWQKRRKRGYEYFGVADHSQSARYAGGLSVEQIRQQHAEVDRLNARFDGRFRIFKGIESDILLDGSLDYPDEILREFDFIAEWAVQDGPQAADGSPAARSSRSIRHYSGST
jgi:histidinol phosphatase-like PHP family hydrolase